MGVTASGFRYPCGGDCDHAVCLAYFDGYGDGMDDCRATHGAGQ